MTQASAVSWNFRSCYGSTQPNRDCWPTASDCCSSRLAPEAAESSSDSSSLAAAVDFRTPSVHCRHFRVHPSLRHRRCSQTDCCRCHYCSHWHRVRPRRRPCAQCWSPRWTIRPRFHSMRYHWSCVYSYWSHRRRCPTRARHPPADR
uniref:(northern house mosquito) hypothetical protein n=1 Tax=Culex pipiens TaxID=7175 RepID=A0A8D8JV91_CULPI